MDAAALAWAGAELIAAGIESAGPFDVVRERPWGSVARVETDRGTLWLKAPARSTAFEAGIYAVLAQAAPGHVLEPVALDVTRGWLLLPDGGPTVRDAVARAGQVRALAGALRAYARLQRAAAPHVEALLAAGVPDMRPQRLLARFDEALAAAGAPAPLVEARPLVVAWTRELAAAPGGASLDHNDLHPANLLDGGRRVFDWGDAVIAHPFACLLMPLGYVAGELGQDPAPLLDAYLDEYADLAPRAELVATAQLAGRLAAIARAHTWERALRDAPPGDPLRERFDGAALHALSALLGPPFERVL